MSLRDEMATAARTLLAGLDEEQREALQQPLGDEGLRRSWTYVPGERAGLTFGDLDRQGRKAVHRLLTTVLSTHAYAQVAAIMALEDVLDRVEGFRRGRHSSDFWTVLFGDPSSHEPWAWRFEGHHVSVNVTVADGAVSATPCFLGANPAAIRYRETTVLRPLGREEELARALLEAMDPAALRGAVVSDVAPTDIRMRDAPRVDGTLEPLGVPIADLGDGAATLLEDLVATYVDRLSDELRAIEARRIPRDTLTFAWEGPLERGAGHYYRIQGRDLLIEYDNTQNDANHVHSVWRRPGIDFGEDLLARHYATADHG
ncbi:MAG TPA: DUF3500 domain-containing protein [Gaiellaceae bacterium]|nr:DUF3500 domain-containing protein [Gaiellaceae bacterium]